MKVHILHAYLSALMGTALVGLLTSPGVSGFRAIAIWSLGILCYALSMPVAVLAVIQKAMELVERQREVEFAKKFEHPEPPTLEVMQIDVDAVRWTIRGMDARVVEKIAAAVMNGQPFTVRSMTGRGKPLTPTELNDVKPKLIALGYLIPAKGKHRARWSRGGLEFMRDVHGGKIPREEAPPPPPPYLKIVQLHG